jgi:hypothetical protein
MAPEPVQPAESPRLAYHDWQAGVADAAAQADLLAIQSALDAVAVTHPARAQAVAQSELGPRQQLPTPFVTERQRRIQQSARRMHHILTDPTDKPRFSRRWPCVRAGSEDREPSWTAR